MNQTLLADPVRLVIRGLICESASLPVFLVSRESPGTPNTYYSSLMDTSARGSLFSDRGHRTTDPAGSARPAVGQEEAGACGACHRGQQGYELKSHAADASIAVRGSNQTGPSL